MTGPDIDTRYVRGHKQGPACARRGGPSDDHRNYFAPLERGVGQARSRQLDGLADVGRALPL
jgi:hypothetical protein